MVWKSCCPSRETPALMAYAWLSFSSFSIRALLASWGETEIGLKLGGGGEGGRAQTRGHSLILHTACTPHHPQRVAVHPPAFPLPFPSYHCIFSSQPPSICSCNARQPGQAESETTTSRLTRWRYEQFYPRAVTTVQKRQQQQQINQLFGNSNSSPSGSVQSMCREASVGAHTDTAQASKEQEQGAQHTKPPSFLPAPSRARGEAAKEPGFSSALTWSLSPSPWQLSSTADTEHTAAADNAASHMAAVTPLQACCGYREPNFSGRTGTFCSKHCSPLQHPNTRTPAPRATALSHTTDCTARACGERPEGSSPHLPLQEQNWTCNVPAPCLQYPIELPHFHSILSTRTMPQLCASCNACMNE